MASLSTSLLVLSGIIAIAAAISTPAAPTTPAESSSSDSCQRMTAALTLDNMHYIFFGNTYIDMGIGLKEISRGNSSYDEFGAPFPEAAFVLSWDNQAYFFSDKYYFSNVTGYAPYDAEYFGGRSHGTFFKDGLDAAGNLNGSTVFFKGCQYVLALPWYPTWPAKMPNVIPCNLDAAFSVGEYLWVFKDDKMWMMQDAGIFGPFDTSDFIDLDNIRLCAAGEKET